MGSGYNNGLWRITTPMRTNGPLSMSVSNLEQILLFGTYMHFPDKRLLSLLESLCWPEQSVGHAISDRESLRESRKIKRQRQLNWTLYPPPNCEYTHLAISNILILEASQLCRTKMYFITQGYRDSGFLPQSMMRYQGLLLVLLFPRFLMSRVKRRKRSLLLSTS